jgi:pSer/pThr/pTyr-binding forkhead associated (FHA) protein
MAVRVVVSFEGAIVTEVELSRPVMVVGRHPDCDIAIDHPAVSLRHALFRVVNRTVYVEDLASTNGTFVNGIAASNQVLHHLDLIQLGMHKLHFFDDSLLAGRVNDLERTVFNDYERTMLASHVQPEPVAAPPGGEPAASVEGLSRTVAIALPGTPAAGPVPGAGEETRDAGRLALRALDGAKAGEVIALDRANTMIGMPGGETALVVKRGKAFFLARLASRGRICLNGREVGPGTHAIEEHDRIEAGRTSYEVIRVGEQSSWNTGT